MSGSFFKDILEQEIRSVFLNPAEFGESVTLEGRKLDVLAVALSDFPDELWPGKPVDFNGERWSVDTADREALRTIRLYRERS